MARIDRSSETLQVEGVRVRFDQNERPELSVPDLAKSKDAALRELATADGLTARSALGEGKKDKWLSVDEVDDRAISGRAWSRFVGLVETAREQHAGCELIASGRKAGKKPATSALALPAPLKVAENDMNAQPRAAFVPLAEHISARFSDAKSYKSSSGEAMYYFDASDLVAGYTMHEIKAAIAIVTYREGVDTEFALTKREDGRYFLIQGGGHYVEMRKRFTGVDMLFHTHPKMGSEQVLPSGPDLGLVAAEDPDRQAAIVTAHGWTLDYDDAGYKPPARALWGK